MAAIIEKVEENSIADDLNLKKGDKLLKINNIEPKDLLDYRFCMAAEEVSLEIEHKNGEIEIIEIEKDSYE